MPGEMRPEEAPDNKKGALDDKAQRRKDAWFDIAAFGVKLVVIVVSVWVLVGVVFGIAVVQGEDMYPRIRDGDLMIFYRLQEGYHIGDVVTFTQDGRRYTGRIVAQSGDTVEITEEGQLLVNGSIQDEEIFYRTEPVAGHTTYPCQVPIGSVFLLCDFRTNATDSRTYGPVAISQLDGKVFTILRRRGI